MTTVDRGKLVILGILAVALGAAAFAWWYRYDQGRRALDFWGQEAAVLIRLSPQVEALRLGGDNGYGTARGTADVQRLDIGEMSVAVEQRQDITRAKGLIHARHALIHDHSFHWEELSDEPTGDGSPQWDAALRFSDDTRQVTVALDFQSGRVCLVEQGRQVRLIEPIAQALKDFVQLQFNAR